MVSDGAAADASSTRSPLADVAWRAVATAFAFNGLLFGAWASRVPTFQDRFALEEGVLGLLLLALAGGALVAFPLAGALSERWGPSRLTLVTAWLYGPVLLLLAIAPSMLALSAALMLFGAVHGAMDVAMNGWGARVEAKLGRRVMSGFHALFSLGAGLGALSGYVTLALGLGVAGHFVALVALAAIPALILVHRAPRIPSERSDGPGGAPVFALPSGTLVLVGLLAFGVAMGEGAMADWSAVFLRTALEQTTEAQAALGYAAFSAAMVAARLAGDAVVQRAGSVVVARTSCVVASVGLAVVIGAPSLPIALGGFVLIGIGYAVVMPLVFSRAARDRLVRPGPAIASVATLGYGGMLLGPPLVGFVAELASLSISFALLGALALLSASLAGQLGEGRPDDSRPRG